MKIIYMGSSKFQIMRTGKLLFILHADFNYPGFLGDLKLRKLIESFTDRFGAIETTDIIDRSLFSDFRKTVDWIISKTGFEPEPIIDTFLAGAMIEASVLYNIKTKKILFSKVPKDGIGRTFFDRKFEIFKLTFQLFQELDGVSEERIRYSLTRLESYWLLSLKYKELILSTAYSSETNVDFLYDFLGGSIEPLLIQTLEPFRTELDF